MYSSCLWKLLLLLVYHYQKVLLVRSNHDLVLLQLEEVQCVKKGLRNFWDTLCMCILYDPYLEPCEREVVCRISLQEEFPGRRDDLVYDVRVRLRGLCVQTGLYGCSFSVQDQTSPDTFCGGEFLETLLEFTRHRQRGKREPGKEKNKGQCLVYVVLHHLCEELQKRKAIFRL